MISEFTQLVLVLCFLVFTLLCVIKHESRSTQLQRDIERIKEINKQLKERKEIMNLKKKFPYLHSKAFTDFLEKVSNDLGFIFHAEQCNKTGRLDVIIYDLSHTKLASFSIYGDHLTKSNVEKEVLSAVQGEMRVRQLRALNDLTDKVERFNSNILKGIPLHRQAEVLNAMVKHIDNFEYSVPAEGTDNVIDYEKYNESNRPKPFTDKETLRVLEEWFDENIKKHWFVEVSEKPVLKCPASNVSPLMFTCCRMRNHK